MLKLSMYPNFMVCLMIFGQSLSVGLKIHLPCSFEMHVAGRFNGRVLHDLF